ncbi:VaFE repeat-containing surface-anchored protein, partial [Corynebacterium mastitidis]
MDDETIEGTAGEVTDIKAEGSDSDVFAGPLKPGEKTTFTGTLVLEEGGSYHADRARAEGVPPSPENPDEPGDVPPVPSDPDEGHAKTPGEPKLELKKFINDNDAQTADEAEELKPGEKATVKFVVTNSGEVDLFNVTLSDETVAGVGDVVNIEPKQIDRLKVGESGEFIGELTLTEGGQDHKDVAKAEGVPPSPENPDEPGDVPPVPSNEDPAHARTPKNFEPKVETSASVDKDGKVAAVESDEAQTVYDTVTMSNLVEDAPYTLDAQLMKKSDSSEIAGASASKSFTASESELKNFTRNEDGSVSGSVVVEIPLPANSLSEGDSAVAFETLTSSADKAKENRAEKLTDGSVPSGDVIADHKDINDEAQTVTYQAKPEPGEPKLELKKYINDNDAQTADEAEVLKPGDKATVKFVVKNTGEVDLFNVTVSDETVAGVGDVVNIEPKQIDRLAVGESGEFTGELTLSEGGQDHKDVAHAEGVPPNPENPDEPGVDEPKVPSNEDPAHAKTPKSGEPKLELKKYINDNDAQTAEEAEELKPGEKATVKFVVKNTGEVDLFNVTVSDETVAGVGDVANIQPQQIDRLAVGESGEFTGELTLTEGGQEHKDVAKVEGVPPSPENPDEPGVDEPKVPSNEDPAHAKTPKPDEPKLELKKYINDNDA